MFVMMWSFVYSPGSQSLYCKVIKPKNRSNPTSKGVKTSNLFRMGGLGTLTHIYCVEDRTMATSSEMTWH